MKASPRSSRNVYNYTYHGSPNWQDPHLLWILLCILTSQPLAQKSKSLLDRIYMQEHHFFFFKQLIFKFKKKKFNIFFVIFGFCWDFDSTAI